MKTTKADILAFLKELKTELESKGIEKIALFGSYAKKNQNIYSDIDIAIQKKRDFLDNYSAYDYFDLVRDIKSKVSEKLHKRVDIFDLDSSSSLKKEIENELIYV